MEQRELSHEHHCVVEFVWGICSLFEKHVPHGAKLVREISSQYWSFISKAFICWGWFSVNLLCLLLLFHGEVAIDGTKRLIIALIAIPSVKWQVKVTIIAFHRVKEPQVSPPEVVVISIFRCIAKIAHGFIRG